MAPSQTVGTVSSLNNAFLAENLIFRKFRQNMSFTFTSVNVVRFVSER
ncbi:hypothetical protein GGR01_000333 [Acetobacter oeni]|nr:hypothetical protein [Acetobacter oeni]